MLAITALYMFLFHTLWIA